MPLRTLMEERKQVVLKIEFDYREVPGLLALFFQFWSVSNQTKRTKIENDDVFFSQACQK